jgi:hypothetical protein
MIFGPEMMHSAPKCSPNMIKIDINGFSLILA